MKKTFLIFYHPGPSWIEGKSIYEQPLESHGNYVQILYRDGKVRLGGPFSDSSGGAILLDVTNGEAEARAITEQDPAVASGILTATVHPWHLIPWEQYGKKSS